MQKARKTYGSQEIIVKNVAIICLKVL